MNLGDDHHAMNRQRVSTRVKNSASKVDTDGTLKKSWRREAMTLLENKVCTKEEKFKQDEKRRANREAAKRCRQRKQKKTEQLELQVKELQDTLLEVNQNWIQEEKKNLALRAEIKNLKYIVKTHI